MKNTKLGYDFLIFLIFIIFFLSSIYNLTIWKISHLKYQYYKENLLNNEYANIAIQK